MSGPNLAVEDGSVLTLAGTDLTLAFVILVVALLALVVAYALVREVLNAGQGTERMQNIARAVQEGAAAYLKRQFRTLAVFAVAIPLLLLLLPADDWWIRSGRSVFFALGAVFSSLTGFMGMWLAVRGNVRVAAAARDLAETRAMRIAFRTGGVAGMFTVGLGLAGAAAVVLLYGSQAPIVLEGFGFGAALLAMFMRVGGGIFTKAADVGADLVGKVEQHIPEDDPRNAATIADNVGDNVGDCAGMAADLFESYAVVLVAALILGWAAFGFHGLVFPLLVPMVGVITAVVGVFAVTPMARDRSGMAAINRGFFISAGASAVLVAVVAYLYLPSSYADLNFGEGGPQGVAADIVTIEGDPRLFVVGAVMLGLLLAAAIQLLTAYFTETDRRPVKEIGESSETGPATVILSGVSVGLESAVYSALLIAGTVYAAFTLSPVSGPEGVTLGLFAVALAGTGLLTTVGVIVSMDTFGPVADNAQGIAEMSGDVEGRGADVLTSLDAVGNTTKAITKGIAIATAVLAATALFGAFRETVVRYLPEDQEFSLSLDVPDVLVGVIIGACVVFLFAGLAISAVGRAAGRVVQEVREQFRTRPGIMDGSEKPEYGRVVDICTRDSLRELATPGLLAVLTPIAVGFGLGYGPLGGFLGGAIAAGVLMAVFLANSGGAWDNAKKLVEDGAHGGKGSEAHEATVIGDTVGDPFKDTAGPAINPLLKVMNLVALLIAPSVVLYQDDTLLRFGVAALAVIIVVVAIVLSKGKGPAQGLHEASTEGQTAVAPSANGSGDAASVGAETSVGENSKEK